MLFSIPFSSSSYSSKHNILLEIMCIYWSGESWMQKYQVYERGCCKTRQQEPRLPRCFAFDTKGKQQAIIFSRSTHDSQVHMEGVAWPNVPRHTASDTRGTGTHTHHCKRIPTTHKPKLLRFYTHIKLLMARSRRIPHCRVYLFVFILFYSLH